MDPGLGRFVGISSLYAFSFRRSPIRKTGLPQWIRPALGGSEVVAALLFLVPAASSVGGYLLLFIFAIAIVIHFLVGEIAGVGSLVVYSMAVIVCMAHRNKSSGGVA